MAQGNAGSISLEIKAMSDKAEQSLAKLEAKVELVTSAMQKLSDTVKGVSSGSSEGFKRLTEEASRLNTGLKTVEKSASKVGATLEKSANKANKLGGTNLTSFLGNIGNLTKIDFSISKLISKAYLAFSFFKRLGSAIGGAVKLGMDYIETENLYAQSMQELYQEGQKWVTKMSEMFGLARADVMHYQATFKNMIGALGGITSRQAYDLSKSVTAMALDYASLFNFDIDEAMEKFQSALSQQTKAIRDTSGFDITQKTLQSVLDTAGIERDIKDLSTVEKRLTIILALQQQIANSGAFDDFGQQIAQPSNQLRILKQQLIEVSTWIGKLALHYIAPFITYAIAMAMALKTIIKVIASLIGYKDPIQEPRKTTLFDSIGGGASEAEKATNKVGKAIDKLKNKLAGFDEITIIGQKETDTSGAGGIGTGGIGGAGVDPNILKAIQQYDEKLQRVSLKAKQIAVDMLKWLGIEASINEETGEIIINMEQAQQKLASIWKWIKIIAGTLLTLFVIVKIINAVITLIAWLEKIQTTISAFQALTSSGGVLNAIGTMFAGISLSAVAIVAFVLAIVGAFAQLMATSASFRKTFGDMMKSVTDFISAIWELVKAYLMPIIEGLITLWNGFVKLMEPFFVIAMDIIKVVMDYLTWVLKMATPFLAVFGQFVWFFFKMIGLILEIAGLLIGKLWSAIKEGFKPLGEAFDTFNKISTEVAGNFLNGIKSAFDAIGKKFGEVFDGIYNKAKEIWDSIINFFRPDKLMEQAEQRQNGYSRSFGKKSPKYASGGHPAQGELFIANEAGAELVGNIGGKTSVASNDMIVNALYGAIYDATINANRATSNQNSGGATRVYLGIKDVTNAVVEEINATVRRTGRNPIESY